jgi:hypothetical protein
VCYSDLGTIRASAVSGSATGTGAIDPYGSINSNPGDAAVPITSSDAIGTKGSTFIPNVTRDASFVAAGSSVPSTASDLVSYSSPSASVSTSVVGSPIVSHGTGIGGVPGNTIAAATTVTTATAITEDMISPTDAVGNPLSPTVTEALAAHAAGKELTPVAAMALMGRQSVPTNGRYARAMHGMRAVMYAFLTSSAGAWTNLLGKCCSELMRETANGNNQWGRIESWAMLLALPVFAILQVPAYTSHDVRRRVIVV